MNQDVQVAVSIFYFDSLANGVPKYSFLQWVLAEAYKKNTQKLRSTWYFEFIIISFFSFLAERVNV